MLTGQYFWHRMILSCKRRWGRRYRCVFFTCGLDILAISMLLLVAKLFLHRNKSTEIEEVLLVSVRRGEG